MEARHSQVIAATPAVLWRCLTEPALLKDWVPGYVDETPEDPARTGGVGVVSTMRLREGSRIKSYRCVVTRWEPERGVGIRISGGAFAKDMHMDVDYAIERMDGACRVDFREQCAMKGLYLILAPLIWLVSRANAAKALATLAQVARRESAG